MSKENLDDYPNRVEEYWDGKVLFITGGTGFLGKVLVEKLLRTVPTIKKLYLLVRPKKGKQPQERLKEIFNGPVSFFFAFFFFFIFYLNTSGLFVFIN